MSPNPITTLNAPAFTRLGLGPQLHGPAFIGMSGEGGTGKSRLACSAMRACPEWFGEKGVYIAVDPEAAALSSILPQDQKNLEVVPIDFSRDVYAQVKAAYEFPWLKEGFKTVITDTGTVLTATMLAQFAQSGKFAGSKGDQHIEIGGGEKLPMPADYQAVNTLFMSLLRKQLASGMNHITLFHDQEVRPEPGQPGEPIGGPATVGKASIRSIVNLYNTFIHLVKRSKRRSNLSDPLEYERVVHTAGHGIWQAKLRTNSQAREVPEIVMQYDPANVWTVLDSIINQKATN